ncbi:MAG: radical SAM protein [Phycisphaeraceae bacterium]|nr:radical SAM protein [Phycisphaeraceae bacterium]
MSIALNVRTTLKQTSSLCPVCRRDIPAEVYEADGRVFLAKTCPEHGDFDVLINSDRRLYYDSLGANSDCGCAAACADAPGAPPIGHDPAIIEKTSTCIALIEIVESCNLKCPTCYADSAYSSQVTALPLEDFEQRIDRVTSRKGPIDILQLSGGEPTIHPRFHDLLAGVLVRDDVGYTLINTNGVRLARDPDFVKALGALHDRHRKFEVYLQFDGPQETGQIALRGADFRSVRTDAVARCQSIGVPVTLAMTVTGDNAAHVGDALRWGLARENVRGLTLQPMFGSGRTHWTDADGPAPRHDRLNVADMVAGLIEQSDGLLGERDFTPLPCGNPNCHTIGYLLRRDGQVVPVSSLIDFSKVQGFLEDRIDFNIEDLQQCGCESEPLGQLLRQLEIGPANVFRIFIKPFMDAWTYDQDRIDRCCVHVVGEGGRLESFCRHYAMRG